MDITPPNSPFANLISSYKSDPVVMSSYLLELKKYSLSSSDLSLHDFRITSSFRPKDFILRTVVNDSHTRSSSLHSNHPNPHRSGLYSTSTKEN